MIKGYFTSTYGELLKGKKNWISIVAKEDVSAFMWDNFIKSDYGKKGGKKRASTAKRDERGRFIKNDRN